MVGWVGWRPAAPAAPNLENPKTSLWPKRNRTKETHKRTEPPSSGEGMHSPSSAGSGRMLTTARLMLTRAANCKEGMAERERGVVMCDGTARQVKTKPQHQPLPPHLIRGSNSEQQPGACHGPINTQAHKHTCARTHILHAPGTGQRSWSGQPPLPPPGWPPAPTCSLP